MQRSNWVRGLLVTASLLSLLLTAVSAQAATRNMVGSLGMINPSVAPPFFFSTGPQVLGKKVGPYAPDTGWTTVDVAGTGATTFVGRQVTLGAGKMNITVVQVRDFSAFPSVANLTKSLMSTQDAATFMENGGALAGCPGPGCTSTGAGTAISWCPPLAEATATPAPGTVGNQIGNWDCASWPAGAGGGDRFMRIGISNNSGRPNYGGTFSLLQNFDQNIWRVKVQPSTPNAADAEVTRSWMQETLLAMTPGRPNFQYVTQGANNGPRVFGRLNSKGAVVETFGCVNGLGDPGGSFMVGQANTGPGTNCGTNPSARPPGQGWGFAMSTGDVEGSDPFPFGLVITSAVPPGTPFARLRARPSPRTSGRSRAARASSSRAWARIPSRARTATSSSWAVVSRWIPRAVTRSSASWTCASI
jgi:hypothetical protein